MALTWLPMYEHIGQLGAFGFYALLNLIGWFLLIWSVLSYKGLCKQSG